KLSDVVARTKTNFVWPDGAGWMMLDADLKDAIEHLPQLADRQTIEQLREVLIAVVPALDDVPMLGLPSASACLYAADTGEQLRGLTGARFYVPVACAADIPLMGKRLFERLVLAGLGFVFISRAGTMLVRSLIDASVWSPERLDFIGGA